MSSYYTTAQLEAMRKARLKKELEDSLKQLKDQLQKESENTIQTKAGSNVVFSVFASDDMVSGYDPNQSVTMNLVKPSNVDESQTKSFDFSSLLNQNSKKSSKLENELDQLIKSLDDRLIITEKDDKDRQRVSSEIQKIITSASMNIMDKVSSVRMRVTSYLQSGTKKDKSLEKQLENRYFEYCALCKMLETKPIEVLPYRIEKEITRLMSVLESRTQQEYIMNTLTEIMDELGCHVKEEAVLDHTLGKLYSVDGHPLCDVFVGAEGSGIMFEPVGESKTGSIDKQRQVERSANSICGLYAILEEKALERGIVLKRLYAVPSDIQQMRVRSDLVKTTENKKQSKRSSGKQQAMQMED